MRRNVGRKEPSLLDFIVVQIRTPEGWAVVGFLALLLVGIGLCFYFHQYLAAAILIALMTVWGLLSAIIAILGYGFVRIGLSVWNFLFPSRPIYNPTSRFGKN